MKVKISLLIDSIKANPYKGLGKPEPLKYGMAGKWSRRINKEHRLVYEIEKSKFFGLIGTLIFNKWPET